MIVFLEWVLREEIYLNWIYRKIYFLNEYGNYNYRFKVRCWFIVFYLKVLNIMNFEVEFIIYWLDMIL